MTEPTFTPWPKIHRLYRPILVTEKIDGTNAAIGITPEGQVYAQSRKLLITPENDNHGFARYVHEHEDELRDCLGEGLHFGEWFGKGIGKRHPDQEKRLALFNVKRWANADLPDALMTVPLLYEGNFGQEAVDIAISNLRFIQSQGLPSPSGTLRPEGVVVFHIQGNVSFKITLENDEMSKGEAEARARKS